MIFSDLTSIADSFLLRTKPITSVLPKGIFTKTPGTMNSEISYGTK
ncbi:unannotated protein [freshwater metagenome]|uniref:Unannotated protein n=1 Tax=freshwater metagenome TaxID=449393 RepID=A0A6J6S3G6_9ZZZZ